MNETVDALMQELASLTPGEPVPADTLLDALASHVEWSYIHSALSEWLEIADMFGRDCNPEVDEFLRLLSESL